MKMHEDIYPRSVEELSLQVKRLAAGGDRVGNWDLGNLPERFEHEAEDLTVTVSAGMKLDELQGRLKEKGQWLPIEPAIGSNLSLETVLSWNHFGSSRVGYGLVRDYVLGIEAVLGDGSIVHSGGRVVKNVAGFDLAKLFIGSCGTLGILTEMTFKLLPLPQASRMICLKANHFEDLKSVLERIQKKFLRPIVWDLESISQPRQWRVWLGFAGTEEAVGYQLKALEGIEFEEPCDSAIQDWLQKQRVLARRWPPVSMRPDKGVDWMGGQEGEEDWLMVPCGCLFTRGNPKPGENRVSPGVERLEERIKAKMDPHGVFPTLSQVRNRRD